MGWISCLYRREEVLARPSLPLLFIVTRSGLLAAVAHVLTTNADGDNIVGRAHVTTCPSAQGSVEGSTGVGRECRDADCRIVVAVSIGEKCPILIRRIFFAVDIITERFQAHCCVYIPDRVARKRQYADGRVTEAASVVSERLLPVRCVVKSIGVTGERFSAGGRVVNRKPDKNEND